MISNTSHPEQSEGGSRTVEVTRPLRQGIPWLRLE